MDAVARGHLNQRHGDRRTGTCQQPVPAGALLVEQHLGWRNALGHRSSPVWNQSAAERPRDQHRSGDQRKHRQQRQGGHSASQHQRRNRQDRRQDNDRHRQSDRCPTEAAVSVPGASRRVCHAGTGEGGDNASASVCDRNVHRGGHQAANDQQNRGDLPAPECGVDDTRSRLWGCHVRVSLTVHRVKKAWASLRCNRNTPPAISTDPTIAVTA